MVNYCRRRGQAAMLQPKFVGPYAVVEVTSNHTYRLERPEQNSVQNEVRFGFLNSIKPCISDSSRYERLLQGFPSPCANTQGPCPAPPRYKKNNKSHLSPSAKTVSGPKTMPRVVLQ